MLWILVSQVSERIYGVAWLRHGELHIRSPKLIIVLDRQLYHSQSIKLMNQRLAFFEGILRTHHKPNLIQIGTVVKRVSDDQMTNMDGIEGTEVKTDFHLTSVLKIR